MMDRSNNVLHQADVCVVGGGMAGLIAAVSAARGGAKVVLMQDRPVLGGNASSEVRMWIRGAHGKDNRETGILQEIELENIYRNPSMNFSVWDSVLLQFVLNESNIELLLNCSCLDCRMEGSRIAAVTGWQLNTYTFHTVEAALFLDCSGDSVLAPLSGAYYRVGREGRSEFDEYGAEEMPDRKTMGSSCLLQARETDHPCSFTPPEWAYVYPDDESLYKKDHDLAGTETNLWWMELGGEGDTILDAQENGLELLKVAFGVWDHIKNHGDHGMENWELDWVGFLPGKRESRRYEGDVILNQRDLEEGHHFPDTVAYGGWTMDNHSPLGLRYPGYSSHHIQAKEPYEIPFRSLYSRNIDNLLFAGRNISATHMAMSSTRVMATCSVIGQAVGTGAALCIRHKCSPRALDLLHMEELQAMLLDQGCYLPGLNYIPTEGFSLSPEEDVLRNGWERPQGEAANRVILPEGGALTITLAAPAVQRILRLALDPDFSRESISDSKKIQTFSMRAHVLRADQDLKMPAPLLRSGEIAFRLEDGSEQVCLLENNRKALLHIAVPDRTVSIMLRALASWGEKGVGLYSCDIK